MAATADGAAQISSVVAEPASNASVVSQHASAVATTADGAPQISPAQLSSAQLSSAPLSLTAHFLAGARPLAVAVVIWPLQHFFVFFSRFSPFLLRLPEKNSE